MIQDYVVELVDALPPKLANVEIPPQDYIGSFRISPATGATPAATPGTQATPEPMSTPVAQVTGTLNEPITLKMFETVEFPDAQLRLTMNGILDESRCPSKVNCAQAGRALLSFARNTMSALAFWNFRPSRPMDDRVPTFKDTSSNCRM